MTLAAILSVWLIHLAAAVSPGPSFVVSVRVAVAEGFATAVALAIGFGLGAVLWAGAAMAGLALLFEVFPALFTAMKLAGAVFLIFIAVLMWRHAHDPIPDAANAPAPRSAWAAMRFGFFTFATNPKPAVFFGAVFVGLVPTDASVAERLLILAIVFANETLWYITVARVFSLPRARAAYTRLKTGLDRTFSVLIAGFGIRIGLG